MRLRRCKFPTCNDAHDPRWGWYCDGHGVTTEEAWKKRDEAERDGIDALRAALEKCVACIEQVLPWNMGGTPDLFGPDDGWDEWADKTARDALANAKEALGDRATPNTPTPDTLPR